MNKKQPKYRRVPEPARCQYQGPRVQCRQAAKYECIECGAAVCYSHITQHSGRHEP